jgi:hypothetical protein
MPRQHVRRAAFALVCVQALQVAYAADHPQAPIPEAAATHITVAAPGAITTVAEYSAWLRELPGRSGDVWVVAGHPYTPSDDGLAVAEMCAAPGATIGAADRVFVRVETLGGLWAKALVWVAGLALVAALICAAQAIRLQHLVIELRTELDEARRARQH